MLNCPASTTAFSPPARWDSGRRATRRLTSVADGKDKVLGSPGGKTEEDVLASGKVYFLKETSYVEVTQPLRDRNGDVIAALKTTLTTFRGETQSDAVARATQIKKEVESGLAALQDIND